MLIHYHAASPSHHVVYYCVVAITFRCHKMSQSRYWDMRGSLVDKVDTLEERTRSLSAGRHPRFMDINTLTPTTMPSNLTPAPNSVDRHLLFQSSLVNSPSASNDKPCFPDSPPASRYVPSSNVQSIPIVDNIFIHHSSPVTQHTPSAPTPGRPDVYVPDNVRLCTVSATVSDTVIAPRPFTGNNFDSDSAENWLNYYERYADYRSLSDADRSRLFCMLMRDTAADWLSTLSARVTQSYDCLKNEFKQTFFKSDQLKWQDASKLFNEHMKPSEKVDEYVTRIKRAARHLNISEELLNFAVISGLTPTIRTHVLSQGLKGLNETIKAAKIAECSLTSDPTAALLLEALQTNKQLVDKQTEDLRSLAKQVAGLQADVIDPSVYSSNNHPQHTLINQPLHSQPQPRMQHRLPRFTSQRHQRLNFPFHPRSNQSYTPQQPHPPTYRLPSPSAQYSQQECGNCGRYHPTGQCPAVGQVCFNCFKIGHFKGFCRSGRRY